MQHTSYGFNFLLAPNATSYRLIKYRCVYQLNSSLQSLGSSITKTPRSLIQHTNTQLDLPTAERREETKEKEIKDQDCDPMG